MTRRPSNGWTLALTAACLVAAVLTSVAPALAQEKVLRVRIGSDMTGLDPAKLFNIENQTISNHIYNGLVRYEYEKNGAIVPDLAEKWDLSADGKTYTFYLRKGVKWHKGYGELTADDVKFSYDRVLDPKTTSRYKGEFKLVETIEVVDPSTVRIRLKSKYPGFLNKVAAYNQGFVVSRKAMEKLGDQYATNPIGTGPFLFESWSPKNQVVLLATKEYFLGAPKLDRIVFRLIQEETTAEIALQRGEIDVFYALQNAEVIARLSKAPGITVHRRTANHTINVILNETYEPLGKPIVRRAIAHSLNLKAMREVFFNGLKGQPNWVLTSSFEEAAKDLTEWPYDPEKAKALLKEAGYPSGFEVTFLVPESGSGMQQPVEMGTVIQAQLLGVGIKAKIQTMEWGAYLKKYLDAPDMAEMSWNPSIGDPDHITYMLLSSDRFPPAFNAGFFQNPRVDELLRKGRTTVGDTERMAIYKEAQRIIADEAPWIFIDHGRQIIIHRKRVQGFKLHPTFDLVLSQVWLQ